MGREKMITQEEITFYKIIENSCNIIFDIGCREDIDYIEISPNKEFHLFEPNPTFYENCKKKIDFSKSNVFLNNFGMGAKTENLEYYDDSQSFIKRTTHFVSKSQPLLLKIKTFTEYLEENNVQKIDFLKIDTEGFEPDILTDNINYIKNNVSYIQFEYASTWLDNKNFIDLSQIYSLYKPSFDFFVLLDKNHPISKFNPNLLTSFDEKGVSTINNFMKNAYGFNIVMVGKERAKC